MNSLRLPEFLTLDEVLYLHRIQLGAHGGQAGIRDQGALESAIAQPQAGFGGVLRHSTLFEQAAAYAFHIAESQAFMDGNKRTGLHAASAFLQINGYILSVHEGCLRTAMLDIATKKLTKQGLAELFEDMARPY